MLVLFCMLICAGSFIWQRYQKPKVSIPRQQEQESVLAALPAPVVISPVTPNTTNSNRPAVTVSTLRVQIDPLTGKPAARATPLPPELLNAISTSSEGLQEVAGTTPAGGIMVHLQGRFQTVVAAKLNTNGGSQNEKSK
jgi:hypothetical protein